MGVKIMINILYEKLYLYYFMNYKETIPFISELKLAEDTEAYNDWLRQMK